MVLILEIECSNELWIFNIICLKLNLLSVLTVIEENYDLVAINRHYFSIQIDVYSYVLHFITLFWMNFWFFMIKLTCVFL